MPDFNIVESLEHLFSRHKGEVASLKAERDEAISARDAALSALHAVEDKIKAHLGESEAEKAAEPDEDLTQHQDAAVV